jgi:transposase
LEEILSHVTPGSHAVLILDQARWQTAKKLAMPHSITLLSLPPTSPELNPVENIWQFMHDNWLSNRIFSSYDQILALCCGAWNRLIHQTWTIKSIGHLKWLYEF